LEQALRFGMPFAPAGNALQLTASVFLKDYLEHRIKTTNSAAAAGTTRQWPWYPDDIHHCPTNSTIAASWSPPCPTPNTI
jgi:hypothetical protein